MHVTDSWIGRVVDGRFRIRERIGAGGMGAVYLADQLDMDRPVVVKVIRSEWAADEQVVARFRSEARIVARLSHPNVVQVFATGEVDGALWLAMEYIDGVTLDEAVRTATRFDEPRATAIGEQIAAALAAAHAAGIVHRDLKPANVMLSTLPGRADHVKVLDFGVARSFDGTSSLDGRLTMTGALVGTPAYMSPEQIEGQPLDGRSDLYALGLILYEMVSGVHPFDAHTPVQWALQHLQTPAPSVDARSPGVVVSPRFDMIVRRCLAKTRHERYESAEHLLRAFGERTSDTNCPAPTGDWPVGQAPQASASSRSRAGMHLFGVALGVVGLLVFVGWVLSRVIGVDRPDIAETPTTGGPEADTAVSSPEDMPVDTRPTQPPVEPPLLVEPQSPHPSDASSPTASTSVVQTTDTTTGIETHVGDAPVMAAEAAHRPSSTSLAVVDVHAQNSLSLAPKPEPGTGPMAPAAATSAAAVQGPGPSHRAEPIRPSEVDFSVIYPSQAVGAPVPAGAMFESGMGRLRSWRIHAPMQDVVDFYRASAARASSISVRRVDETFASVRNTNRGEGWTMISIFDEPEGVRISVFIR